MVDYFSMVTEGELRRAQARWERERKRADEQRARVFRAASQDGWSRRKIARAAGLSFQRVDQIIHNGERE